MAQAFNATPRILHTPGIVKSNLVREALLEDSEIAKTIDMGKKADIALVGIGVLSSTSITGRPGIILNEKDIRCLEERGAIGDIALQFFDKNGDKVKTDLDKRIVGLSLQEMKKIKRVIAVAGGKEKLHVVHAVLKGKLVNVIITDDYIAKNLIATSNSLKKE